MLTTEGIELGLSESMAAMLAGHGEENGARSSFVDYSPNLLGEKLPGDVGRGVMQSGMAWLRRNGHGAWRRRGQLGGHGTWSSMLGVRVVLGEEKKNVEGVAAGADWLTEQWSIHLWTKRGWATESSVAR